LHSDVGGEASAGSPHKLHFCNRRRASDVTLELPVVTAWHCNRIADRNGRYKERDLQRKASLIGWVRGITQCFVVRQNQSFCVADPLRCSEEAESTSKVGAASLPGITEGNA
jgi:hypothetical protein